MKRTLLHTLTILMMSACALGTLAQTYVPTAENLASRQDFADRRFGVFLHWGLYATFAQGEWYMNLPLDAQEYAKAMQSFYPHNFDAQAWVSAIKDAGAGYICFTSRHHEGFSMWDTKQSDYNIMNSPYGKDIIKQLADACHAQDMRLHLYYSHLDWTRTDYPLGRTGHGTRKELKPDWPAYYRFMNNQLTELLTNYGEIGAIWFDGWWDHDSDATPFDWQLPEQYALIHRLQPACLVGNNHHQSPFEGEDIQIFERDVPGENKAGLSGQEVTDRLPLETCQTMNGMWGYKIKDQDYKSVKTLVRLLVRTASKGANLLLNIGPQPDGSLPQTALERLKGMGEWMRANGHTIYKTRAGGIAEGETLVSTRTDKQIFLHCIGDTIPETVTLPIDLKIKTATDATGRRLTVQRQGKTAQVLTLPCAGAQREPDYIVTLDLK